MNPRLELAKLSIKELEDELCNVENHLLENPNSRAESFYRDALRQEADLRGYVVIKLPPIALKPKQKEVSREQ